jgi:transcriptional repressor NrdR
MSSSGSTIRRRRMCNSCKRRFTTYERLEEALPMVVKKDNRREPFDRQKIIAGLRRACEKRPVSMETIEEIADRVERAILDRGGKEVPSSFIGNLVMNELHKIDQVAYVRFASVYRSFKDIDEFMHELQDLIRHRQAPAPEPPARSRDRKGDSAS